MASVTQLRSPYAGLPETPLRVVLDSAREAFVSIDVDGRVLMWNPAAEETFGFSEAEALGRRLSELIIPERHREAHERGLAHRVQTGEGKLIGRRIEIEGVHRDGREIPVELTISPAVVDGRTVYNAFLHDISERRAANAEAQRLAAIVESSDDAVIAWSLEGVVTSWNPGAERLLGYAEEEILGRSVRSIWPPDSSARFEAARAKLAAGQAVPAHDSQRVGKDGVPIDVSVTLSPVKDSDGHVIGVSSIFRDITESKRAQQALNVAQRRFQRAFESAPIGIGLIDTNGAVLAANRALCRLLGRTEDELLATNFPSISHPQDRRGTLEQVHRALGGEIEDFTTEQRYLRPDGEVVWASASVSLVRDGDGEPLYFISQLQDVTERKHAEQELRSYSEHLNDLALQDPLTGLRNYRDFHAMLDSELQRARRHGQEWSVVLLDVDAFTALNAERGHPEGDRALQEVAAAIEGACRTSDRAARVGADEFALVLPETTTAGARETAERIAAAVAQGSGTAVSYGVASWPADGDTKELVLLRADMELHAAKPAPDASRNGHGRPLEEVAGVERILAIARQQLGMDVAYVAEITDDTQVLRSVSGETESFGVGKGAALPLDATYCTRMLAGKLPNAVPDTAAEPEARALEITARAGVGAYLGVPLELPDGRLYGTLCGVSHSAQPELGSREVDLMRFLAELIADQIDRDQREASARRANVELAGINALLAALVARDHYTGEHSKTVVRLARAVARRLGLPTQRVVEVEQVALLHDIGKVGIPDAVLQKRSSLDDGEWALMRQHPAIGARIVAGTAHLSHLAAAVKAEHERFDGGGYPDGLRGEAIPLASRITFACDAYHAMTSDRPYRAALGVEEARAELRAGAGGQFDPAVVEALIAVLESEEDGCDALPEPDVRAGPLATVLDAATPRQTPAWEPRAGGGSTAAIGEVRAVCRGCGTHVAAVATRAALSGSCGNCGSYELDLVKP